MAARLMSVPGTITDEAQETAFRFRSASIFFKNITQKIRKDPTFSRRFLVQSYPNLHPKAPRYRKSKNSSK